MERMVPCLLAAVLLLGGVCGGCIQAENTAIRQNEYVIGALLPVTGDAASLGEASDAAIQVAVGDVNAYLAGIESQARVRVIVKDTKTDPATALEKLKELKNQGVNIVIGPGSSTEALAVKDYADANGILLVATMSTAPSLAVHGDNLFRYVPDDRAQSAAIAYMIESDRVTTIVPIRRGDIWGDELYAAAKEHVEKSGCAISEGVRYEPGTKDFSGAIADLDVQVGRAITAAGHPEGGVYAITLDELPALMVEAAGTANLSRVRWYGCDGNVLIDPLVADPDASKFAVATSFSGPAFWVYPDAERAKVIGEIRSALGRDPDGYSLATYDALWVAALVRTQTETKNITAIRQAFVTMSKFEGLTGTAFLDENGDRATVHYGFWAVANDNGAYRWIQYKQYDIWRPDQTYPSVTWIEV